jgi:hypothetical protein
MPVEDYGSNAQRVSDLGNGRRNALNGNYRLDSPKTARSAAILELL